MQQRNQAARSSWWSLSRVLSTLGLASRISAFPCGPQQQKRCGERQTGSGAESGQTATEHRDDERRQQRTNQAQRDWITSGQYLPWWVAGATHLIFGGTMALLAPVADVCSMNPNVVSDHSTTIRSRLNRESSSVPSSVTSTLSMIRAPRRSSPMKTGGSTVSTMPA